MSNFAGYELGCARILTDRYFLVLTLSVALWFFGSAIILMAGQKVSLSRHQGDHTTLERMIK